MQSVRRDLIMKQREQGVGSIMTKVGRLNQENKPLPQ